MMKLRWQIPHQVRNDINDCRFLVLEITPQMSPRAVVESIELTITNNE